MIEADKKTLTKHILIVASSAFALRLIYFLLALDNLGIENYFHSISDTSVYWKVARNFVESSEWGEYWLFQVGPGYGLILLLTHTVSFGSYFGLYLMHILMGTAGSVLVYLIADRLFGNAKISLLAGLINAVSLTSIALSCNILSDQPFFTLFALSLLCFLMGLEKNRILFFVISGIVGGIAAYIRGVIIFWPFLLLIIIPLIAWIRSDGKKGKRLWSPYIVPAIILISIQGLSFYNYLNHDIYTFGGNGMRAARLRLAAMAVSKNTDSSYEETLNGWFENDSLAFNYQIPLPKDDYRRNADGFISVLKEHPGWIAGTFLQNVKANMLARNNIPRSQIPALDPLWSRLNSISGRWFNQALFFLTILGLIIMIVRKEYIAAILLGAIYFYFTAINGFTFWQGSRLHYPAELAWSIIISFVIYWLISYAGSLKKRI